MSSDSRPHPELNDLYERATGPFADLELRSRRSLQQFSFAAGRGAENLLIKARRALDAHDFEQAVAYVDRAVRLPFDEHEGAAPAALEVHMQLFSAVTDALKQADEDDSGWLDAALEVLAASVEAEPGAACDLRDVLVAIDQDYSLSWSEHRRIAAAITPVPARAELRDLDLTAPELREHVVASLRARRSYDHALEARGM